MNSRTLAIGRAYLDALAAKDVERIRSLVHPEVTFKTPLLEFSGRDEFVAGTQRLLAVTHGLKVTSAFSSDDQAIFTYDLQFSDPIGMARTANLMTFEGDKIRKIELFYDARPFEKLAAGLQGTKQK